MPIPARSNRDRDPQAGIEAKSKIPSARGHQRTISTMVPDVKQVARTHQRASSVRIGPTEQTTSSLLRKPSVRTDPTSIARQPTAAGRQTTKLNPAVPFSAVSSAPKADSGLRIPTSKPQFTAYQQHFSPKKPPRPASIAIDTPSSNEGANASPDGPEIARLRDEFLQLRLIHAGSQETLQRFETDAKTKLKSRFDTISKRKESIVALEQHRTRCISHTSLQKWLQPGGEVSNDKLYRLASCLRELDSLTTTDGRYLTLIGQFQAWFEQMIVALDSRKHPIESTVQTLLFVEPIDPLWMHEAAEIQRKLQNSRRSLQELGDADAGGICFVLNSYKRLADNLFQELESCVFIHKNALEQEDTWIANSLQILLEGDAPAQREAVTMCRRGIWEISVTDLG